MQIAIIFGGMLATSYGSIAPLLIVIGCKTLVDMALRAAGAVVRGHDAQLDKSASRRNRTPPMSGETSAAHNVRADLQRAAASIRIAAATAAGSKPGRFLRSAMNWSNSVLSLGKAQPLQEFLELALLVFQAPQRFRAVLVEGVIAARRPEPAGRIAHRIAAVDGRRLHLVSNSSCVRSIRDRPGSPDPLATRGRIQGPSARSTRPCPTDQV